MATIKQKILPVIIEKNGDEREMYFQNRGKDVTVGNLAKANTLRLPASSANETMETALQYIKAYLFNLENVAAVKYTVSGSNQTGGTNSLATSAAVKANYDAIQALQGNVGDVGGDLSGKAPMMHAADTTVYGGATGAKFGHVKLSDIYNTTVLNGYNSAADSVGASQKAVFTAYNELNTGKAPTNHATTSLTYGGGTGSNYGHVKLTDNYTSNGGNASGSIAASGKAVYDFYNAYLTTKNALNDMVSTITGNTTGTGIDSVRLCQYYHADADARKHGMGNGAVFGHVKLSDVWEDFGYTDISQLDRLDPSRLNYDTSIPHAANGIAASQYASMAGDRNCLMYTHGLMVNHRKEVARNSELGHVRLFDTAYGNENTDGTPAKYTKPNTSSDQDKAVHLLGLYNTAENLSKRIYNVKQTADKCTTLKDVSLVNYLVTQLAKDFYLSTTTGSWDFFATNKGVGDVELTGRYQKRLTFSIQKQKINDPNRYHWKFVNAISSLDNATNLNIKGVSCATGFMYKFNLGESSTDYFATSVEANSVGTSVDKHFQPSKDLSVAVAVTDSGTGINTIVYSHDDYITDTTLASYLTSVRYGKYGIAFDIIRDTSRPFTQLKKMEDGSFQLPGYTLVFRYLSANSTETLSNIFNLTSTALVKANASTTGMVTLTYQPRIPIAADIYDAIATYGV